MINLIRQACILVGGKGTRLGHMTHAIPKPLLDIGRDTTFLDVLIGQVVEHGFDDIILLAGYLGHLVEQRYHNRRLATAHIRVMIESELRGTGGALLSARDAISKQFILLNGDSFFDINLSALAAQASELEAVIALRCVPDASRFGAVELCDSTIRRFREKSLDVCGPALINAGIYVLRRSVLERIKASPCSLETDIFPRMAAEGQLSGVVCNGYFIDIGLPETLEQARRELFRLYSSGVPWRTFQH